MFKTKEEIGKMKTVNLLKITAFGILLIMVSCGKKISLDEDSKISDLLNQLKVSEFKISEETDYPILAILNCVEGKMVTIDGEVVIILNFNSVENAKKYAITYAGSEKSNKTFHIGKFVIRSENSYDIGKKIRKSLADF